MTRPTYEPKHDCHACGGDGYVADGRCPACNGLGRLTAAQDRLGFSCRVSPTDDGQPLTPGGETLIERCQRDA